MYADDIFLMSPSAVLHNMESVALGMQSCVKMSPYPRPPLELDPPD